MVPQIAPSNVFDGFSDVTALDDEMCRQHRYGPCATRMCSSGICLLGAFSESRKSPIAFVMYVRLSSLSAQLFTGRISVKFILRALCAQSVEKPQIWSKSVKNMGHFTRKPKNVLLLPVTLNRLKSPPLVRPLVGWLVGRCSFTLRLMTSEDGTHSCSRNVVGKFTSHTVQISKTKDQYAFHGESLKSRKISLPTASNRHQRTLFRV